MAGLKSKMLSRGRKKNQTKASSSSSASPASSDAAKAAAVAKLTAIRQEAASASASAIANASSDVDVDLNSPSNRTAATSASATPSPSAALDRSAGEGVEVAEAEADLDLTGTLEEVNQILGIVPATTNSAVAEAEAVADTAAATTAADAASSSLRGPREEARDGRSMLDESEEVPPSPLMDYSKSCPSGDDEDDEVGIEVQLQLEPSFDDQAIGLDGGVGVVIQEPTVAGQKKILVPTEEVSSEAMEEAVDLSAIAPTALFPEPEPVEAVVVEEKSLQADTAEVEGTTAPAAPVVTPEAGASDAAATAGAAVAAGAATAASVAASAAASDSRAPNEADADTAPPAKKGAGLGVSKFPDKAEPALDDCVSFITAFKASFTEAVQPGLDSVRKTLNFGATPPPSKVEEGGSNNAAAVAAAAVVSADKGANSSQTTSNDAKPVLTPTQSPTETMADSPIGGPSDTSFSSKANGVAKTLLTAFNCASNDTTKPIKVGKQVDASPTSNSLFESPSTLTSTTKAEEDAANARFLKEITEEGIVLLVHQAPNSTGGNPTSDWTQKIVRVYIKPGSGSAGQPKLMWARNKSLPMTRKTGVPEDRTGKKKIRWTSLDLLDIHSILGATDGDKLPTSNEEQMEKKGDESEGGIAGQSCFFTITSGKGAVFVFEAMTPEERNRVSKGLQAVITGLARALITGDIDKYVALVKDARDEEAEEEGELPSLRTPAQAMNEIAHALLD